MSTTQEHDVGLKIPMTEVVENGLELSGHLGNKINVVEMSLIRDARLRVKHNYEAILIMNIL